MRSPGRTGGSTTPTVATRRASTPVCACRPTWPTPRSAPVPGPATAPLLFEACARPCRRGATRRRSRRCWVCGARQACRVAALAAALTATAGCGSGPASRARPPLRNGDVGAAAAPDRAASVADQRPRAAAAPGATTPACAARLSDPMAVGSTGRCAPGSRGRSTARVRACCRAPTTRSPSSAASFGGAPARVVIDRGATRAAPGGDRAPPGRGAEHPPVRLHHLRRRPQQGREFGARETPHARRRVGLSL